MSSHFGLTDNELAFLAAHVGSRDRVFEYGVGGTTAFFASKCRHVTAVEHQAKFAMQTVGWARGRHEANVSVIYAPPDFPYVEGGEDGDLATFRHYVESYVGRGIDVVLIDGRSRVECARWVAERAPFGPDPSMRVFLHDVDRPALAPIYTDTVVDGLLVPRAFDEVARVERLMLLKMKEG